MIIDLLEGQREGRVLCSWCERLAAFRTMDGEPVCSGCFCDSLQIERTLRAVIRAQVSEGVAS
jgi:hypothetical protein